MQQHQLNCPNCGATITNTQNCDYCGSMLIRLQQQGINIAAAGYNDENRVFKGLADALKRNLELQSETSYKEAVATDFYYARRGQDVSIAGVYSGLAFQDGSTFLPHTKNDNKPHLKISFSFDSLDSESMNELQKFRNLDIYELFHEHISTLTECESAGGVFDAYEEYNYTVYEYAIDFGEDAEGAAQLISRVFHEVMGIPYENRIMIYTNKGKDINKQRVKISGVDEEKDKKWEKMLTIIPIVVFIIWLLWFLLG